MPATPGNALDITSAGLVKFDGTSTFSAVTVTQFDILVGGASNGISSIGPGSSGQVLQSAGNASNPAYSTATYPATATSTGTILRADGTNWSATTATYPNTAGTSGNVLTSDGTNWNSSAPVSQFTPNSVINLYDDFVGDYSSGTSLNTQLTWLQTGGTNAWTTAQATPDSAHYGVVSHTSMTSANRGIWMGIANTGALFLQLILGGGAITLNWVFKIVTASNSTNRYTLRLGLGDTNTTTNDQANGLYFEYSDNINSGNWVYKSASASTRTTSNSSVAATVAYHNAQITINAAASSVSFSMDGVSLGTAITSNIPTTGITPFLEVVFGAGTVAAGSIMVDLFYMTQTLTTPR